MLNVVVCIKAVPDPQKADRIRIDPLTRSLTRGDVPFVLNPLDKNAIELALQIKEQTSARVTAVSMGPPEAAKIVRECLALGADQGVLLCDGAFAGADAYATAYTLAKGIGKLDRTDLVLCGMASSDGSTEWVGPMLATFLDIPVVTMVNEIVESSGSQWRVRAGVENGYRLVQIDLPALLTVTRDLNSPRALSFSGIIKARKKEIQEWGLEDLAVEEDTVGHKGSPTIVSELATQERKRQVEMLAGTREEKIERLAQELVDAGVL